MRNENILKCKFPEENFSSIRIKDPLPKTILQSIVVVLSSLSAPFVLVYKYPHQVGIETLCSLFLIHCINNSNQNFSVKNFKESLQVQNVIPNWCFNFLNFLFFHQIENLKLTPIRDDGKSKLPMLPPPETTHTFVLSTNIELGRMYIPLPNFPPSGKIQDANSDSIIKYLAIYDSQDTKINSLNGCFLLFLKLEKNIDLTSLIKILKSNLKPSIKINYYNFIDVSEWVKSFINQQNPVRLINLNSKYYYRRGYICLNKAAQKSISLISDKQKERLASISKYLNNYAGTQDLSKNISDVSGQKEEFSINCWLLVRESTDAQLGQGKSLLNQACLDINSMFFLQLKNLPNKPPFNMTPRLIIEVVSCYWTSFQERTQIYNLYQEIEEFDVVIVASLDRLTRRGSDFSEAVQLFTNNHISLFIIMAPIDLFGDGISLLVDFDKSSCYTTTVKMWANASWTQVATPFDQVIEQLKNLFSGFIQLSIQHSIYVGRYYEQIKWIERNFGEMFIDSFCNDKVLPGIYFSRTSPGKFNQTSSSISNSNEDQIIFLKGLISLSESSKNPQVPAHSYKSIDKPTYQKNNDEYNIEIEDENEKDDFLIVNKINQFSENEKKNFIVSALAIDRLIRDETFLEPLLNAAEKNNCLIIIFFPFFEFIKKNHSDSFLLETINSVRIWAGNQPLNELSPAILNYSNFLKFQISKEKEFQKRFNNGEENSKYWYSKQCVYPTILSHFNKNDLMESIKRSQQFLEYIRKNIIPYSRYHGDFKNLIGNKTPIDPSKSNLILPPQEKQYNIVTFIDSCLNACNVSDSDRASFNNAVTEASSSFHYDTFTPKSHSNVSKDGYFLINSIKAFTEEFKNFEPKSDYKNLFNSFNNSIKNEPEIKKETTTTTTTTPAPSLTSKKPSIKKESTAAETTTITTHAPKKSATETTTTTTHAPPKKPALPSCSVCENKPSVHIKSPFCSRECAQKNNNSKDDPNVFKECVNYEKCNAIIMYAGPPTLLSFLFSAIAPIAIYCENYHDYYYLYC
ncbi:hypothetical protein DICPUDRAFT_84601 [Dictyostelium purpureum]|uniref:Resolvase/invertase-type recombinase catalytic domain-containing protein n=1 Tax=Dictyostelium purpureum TaxID=5786 RepID=F1A358_DICPU|nr:uncharacterized protein DICPUDRAFT_84601 [Dictyostelium purpureum]EGC29373.1 hypothetical protein DICPUDRAFT_84601 [Dictyostelium purpureum]|eukprot:XP_003294101.1 hypothetical protein DICPUDRAFT_84601 [Dictyostelium purpureum]